MLRRRRSLLILIAVANMVLVAGILYAVWTVTFNLNIDDYGGNPASCSGSAEHRFIVDPSIPYHYSYATTVRHNGSYVNDYYNSGSGTGPADFIVTSATGGTATYVNTWHNTTGDHGSYIENDNDPSDWSQSPKSSSTNRSSD